ncbi:dipeptidase [Fulvivirga maritima]|uniref:dipeptidase n=1 Tax=Fulvivirga maritima TaxID=2904247 RepID=UPI001F31A97A|nr:dipeptidase [Fulvivirga maritima]UII27821.1 dipeptidase [Fulvivirga maritima]
MLLAIRDIPKKEDSTNDNQLKIRAQELALNYTLVDTHVDLPYRLKHSHFNIEEDQQELISTKKGDFDFERAKIGGLDAPFMSIYIPSDYQVKGGAPALADSLIDMVNSIATALPEKFEVATSPADVERIGSEGKIALPMGIENGAAIEDSLGYLTHFKERGISYITLTHAKDNLICDSSYDTAYTWNGLSKFGEQVVLEMNQLGIMVDVSHISDSAFYDVMRISKTPVIASHSSCRHFTSGFERNMSDDMITLLAKKGGVIQINFGSTFVDDVSREKSDAAEKYMKDHNLTESDSLFITYLTQNPIYSNLDKVADHIDHIVQLVGIDYVGLGSDFDGVGDTLPTELKDVSNYPNLIYTLLKRGYSESDIEKICSKNIFRVWQEVIDYAEDIATP